jgi:hypothetical protein
MSQVQSDKKNFAFSGGNHQANIALRDYVYGYTDFFRAWRYQ